MGDAENDAFLVLRAMRDTGRWKPERAAHLTRERQERMVIAWARLRLIDKYETEFARQKRTLNMSHNFPRTPDAAERHDAARDSLANPIDSESEDAPALSRLDRDEIAAMIERLPDRQKQIVKLLLYEGMTQQEAADSLGVSQPAVWATYERARETLRSLLAQYVEAR